MNDGRVYENEKSRFDGGLLGLININILCGLISIVTLSIGVPWAIVLKYRWYVSHIRYGGRVLKFDGTGGQLIGSYLLWLLFKHYHLRRIFDLHAYQDSAVEDKTHALCRWRERRGIEIHWTCFRTFGHEHPLWVTDFDHIDISPSIGYRN